MEKEKLHLISADHIPGSLLLLKWAIKYDNTFNMPEYVQGTFIGKADDMPIKNGEFVRIHDIESFDMLNKKLKTSKGQEFILIGKGEQIIMVDNDLAFKIMQEHFEEEES